MYCRNAFKKQKRGRKKNGEFVMKTGTCLWAVQHVPINTLLINVTIIFRSEIQIEPIAKHTLSIPKEIWDWTGKTYPVTDLDRSIVHFYHLRLITWKFLAVPSLCHSLCTRVCMFARRNYIRRHLWASIVWNLSVNIGLIFITYKMVRYFLLSFIAP